MRVVWLVMVVGWTAIGLISIPVSTISRAIGLTPWGYELPDDATLQKALVYCQIDRFSTREYVLCPRRLPASAFSPYLGKALIASEDRQFYQHHGVDKLAIVKAFAINLLRIAGGPGLGQRGGSTITQQLSRILFLDEREGMMRKLREAALAPRIEQVASKKDILTAYMNVVPHAHGMNGFDAAARYFFGVPASEVLPGEAALLVGMLPAPNDRDPERHPDAGLDAAVRVLARMAEQGMITAEQQHEAEQRLTWRIRDNQLQRGRAVPLPRIETRPYRDLAVAEAARHGADVGDEFRLITYMDLNVQDWVVSATARLAGDYQMAGVFMRPTGEVLGISGSRDYVESSLNRAFRMHPQIGSTGKLFVLVAALKNGFDVGHEFPARSLDGRGWPAEPDALCRGRPMTLPEAMTHSCNRPFTWAAYRLAGRLKDVVHEFELKPPDAPALVPLGGIEASPLQLARAYAAVANDGWLPNARTLVAALGRRGNVLYTSAPYSVRVMTPQTIAAVRDALRRPVESGTARRANSDYATVYGKTGTTSRDKDALFVGLTDDYVGAFWIGTDNSQSMHRIYGSGRPTQAFRFVTDSYYRTRSPPPQIMGAERTPPWWLHTPDFLQDRRRRYYIILGAIGWSISIAAAFAVRFWLRLRGPIRGHVAQVLNVLRIPHEAFVRFAQRLKQIRFSRS